jgi:hypothetical protein
LLKLGEEQRALTLENLANSYRCQEKIESQRETLEKSLDIWKKLGGHPGDQACDYAYLAEIARTTGDYSKYSELRDLVEKLALSEELTLLRRANVLLYIADCAEIYADYSWESIILEKGEKLTMKDKQLKNFFEFFEQCIQDLNLNGKRGPEKGLDRIERPPMFRSEALSGVFEVVFHDPDFGN